MAKFGEFLGKNRIFNEHPVSVSTNLSGWSTEVLVVFVAVRGRRQIVLAQPHSCPKKMAENGNQLINQLINELINGNKLINQFIINLQAMR